MFRLVGDFPVESESFSDYGGPAFRLVEDGDGAIACQFSYTTGLASDAEVIPVPEPIATGYLYFASLQEELECLSSPDYGFIASPRSLLPGRAWHKGADLGLYSITIATDTIIEAQSVFYAPRNGVSEPVIIEGVTRTPLVVLVEGLEFSEGTNPGQWQYQDTTLTLFTDSSYSVSVRDRILVTSQFTLLLGEPAARVVSFQFEADDVIVGFDYLGISFSLAVDNYAPVAGEFTFSEEGVLNLFIPLSTSPPIVSAEERGRITGIGKLTYPRPQ